MTRTKKRPLTLDGATRPAATDPDAGVQAWQDGQIRAAIREADDGRFASDDDVRQVIRRFVRTA